MLKNKTRVKAILFSLLFLLLFSSPAPAGEKGRVVEVTATGRTIVLDGTEPAARVVLRGLYCNVSYYRKKTLEKIDFFKRAEARLPAAPAGDQATADAVKEARKLLTESGIFYAEGSGHENETYFGLRAFWGIKEKTTADFLADAPPGETRTRVMECYSESDLKELMDLQREAARSFLNSAEGEEGESK